MHVTNDKKTECRAQCGNEHNLIFSDAASTSPFLCAVVHSRLPGGVLTFWFFRGISVSAYRNARCTHGSRRRKAHHAPFMPEPAGSAANVATGSGLQ